MLPKRKAPLSPRLSFSWEQARSASVSSPGVATGKSSDSVLLVAGLPLYFSRAVLGSAGRFIDALLGPLGDGLTRVLCRSARVFAGFLDVLAGSLRVVLCAVLRKSYPDG